ARRAGLGPDVDDLRPVARIVELKIACGEVRHQLPLPVSNNGRQGDSLDAPFEDGSRRVLRHYWDSDEECCNQNPAGRVAHLRLLEAQQGSCQHKRSKIWAFWTVSRPQGETSRWQFFPAMALLSSSSCLGIELDV